MNELITNVAEKINTALHTLKQKLFQLTLLPAANMGKFAKKAIFS